MDLENYKRLMEPVSVLELPEEVAGFLSDQGIGTVLDLLDQELAYFPAEIADLLRSKLEDAGLVEPFEPEPSGPIDPAGPTTVDLDGLWQAVTEDWKVTVDPSTIREGLVLHPHEHLNAQNVEALVQRVKKRKALGLQVYGDAELWVQALARTAAKKTRTLIFDTPWENLSTQVLSVHGELTPCIDTMPDLRFLFCVGTFSLDPLHHSKLRHMYLLADPLTADTVAGICDSHLASLETLALGFAAEGEASPEAMEALYKGLAKTRWPKLRTLILEGIPSCEIALGHILSSPLAAQLKTLQLGDEFTDEDEALAVIEPYAHVFAKTELIAPFDTFSEDGFKRLKKIVPYADPMAEIESVFLPDTYF